MSALVIMRLTFREAARSRILLAAVLLGLVFLVVFGLGFNFVIQEMRATPRNPGLIQQNEISNFLLLAGLYAVNFLTVMMTVLTSVATLSGEISTGTIQTLVTKPLRRWEIVIGKFLGFSIMLTGYLILMAGGVSLLVRLISGYRAPDQLLGLSFMWLNVLMLLSLSLLGSSTFSTLANGVLIFGLFGIAFVGGWIEQFGSLIGNQTAIQIGIISSLILPSEALWKRAVFEMQSPLVSALGFSPFSASTVPSPLFIWYAVGYALIALVLSIRRFQRRDL